MEQTSWDARLRGKKLEMFTGKYYAACAAGGMISTGSVHLLVTPFDMMKVNMQAYPLKYQNITSSFGTVYREQGMTGIWKGWSSKLFGYSAQGACKFGLYEYFKKSFSDRAGLAVEQANSTLIYMASSLSAQVIADVALCPFEAVKVHVQTQPNFAKGVCDGFPKLYATEGITGFYKGQLPLWARNLPFAMLMFSSFEHSVNFIYEHVLNRHKSECSMWTQLGVTCIAGYMSGVTGTVISNPADNILTALYNHKGITFLQAARQIGIVGLFTRSLPLRVMLTNQRWEQCENGTIRRSIVTAIFREQPNYCGKVAPKDTSRITQQLEPIMFVCSEGIFLKLLHIAIHVTDRIYVIAKDQALLHNFRGGSSNYRARKQTQALILCRQQSCSSHRKPFFNVEKLITCISEHAIFTQLYQ